MYCNSCLYYLTSCSSCKVVENYKCFVSEIVDEKVTLFNFRAFFSFAYLSKYRGFSRWSYLLRKLYQLVRPKLKPQRNLEVCISIDMSDQKKICILIVNRLFETHPEVQDVFLPFKGLSKVEMEHSKQLRTHALRVMCFVEKCIARIDQPEKLIALCLELGSKHQRYGAPVEYLDVSNQSRSRKKVKLTRDTKLTDLSKSRRKLLCRGGKDRRLCTLH